MKILNLDKLSSKSNRVLTINGTDHPIVPMSIENFIETTEAVQTLIKEDAGPDKQLVATIDAVLRLVPSLPREQLLKYDLAMINTIAAFVRGDDVEEQEEQAAAAVEAGK